MKAWIVRLSLVIGILMSGLSFAAVPEIRPLRLSLELTDGSRVIGIPTATSISVQTAYAKMDIPFGKILSVKMEADHKNGSFQLANGDKLQGVVSIGPVQLETLFGKIAVSIEHIKELSVVLSGRALPDTFKQGLVLCYSFDKDDGEKVTDSSSRRNDGRVYGAKWVARSARGAAYEFNGHGDYIEVGNTADLDFDSSKGWTFSFWVQPEGDLSQMCFYHRAGPDHCCNGGENYLYYATESTPATGISWGPVNGEWHTGVPLLLDQWQQVVVLYSASVRTASLYVNGSERASVPVRSVGRSSGPLRIGDNANANFFRGMIGELMIFNRALSDEEVKKLYDSQK